MGELDLLVFVAFLVAHSLFFFFLFFFFPSEEKENRSRILYDTSFLHVIDELQEWLVLTSALEVCVFNREEV